MTWVNDPNPALAVLIAAVLAPLLTIIVGYWEPRRVSHMAIFSTAVAFAMAVWGSRQDDASWSANWIEDWGIQFAVSLDGLAAMYSLLATGIGLLVVLYASHYMPLHRAHVGQRPVDDVRFYGFLLLFMASMVGLVMSQDLILLFVFWDLTAVASYYLIGFDREDEESRESALMALLVTGITAIGVLIGAIILWHEYGTFSLPRLFEVAEPTAPVLWAIGLILAGALAKSAQFPLHFWLPRAMAAPTPVSAYLHSAAMVAAGVFLVGRIYPLVALDDRMRTALVVIGGASMLVGGMVALTRDVFKQVLAYSTISQYGYVVVLFGLGGVYGVGGATFYVIAHALAKSALFMTAGAITEATGAKTLSGVGGLAPRMPLLAFGSGLAAMAMMALPLTIGFFKDELFFAAATESGRPMQVFAILGATLSFAYIGRLWLRWFTGDPMADQKPIPRLLVWPVVLLGGAAIVGGITVGPFKEIAERAASISFAAPVRLDLTYHLDTRPENVMALIAYGLGIVVVASEPLWRAPLRSAVSFGQVVGPLRIYASTLRGANAVSDAIHRLEVRDLRSRIATILAPAGVLVAMAVVVSPIEGSFVIGGIRQDDLPLVMMLAAAAVSAVVVTFPRDHLRLVLTLSCVGFSLAVVYAFLGAPDVALVAVLIETLFVVVFLGMLALMPRSILRYETSLRPERRRVARDAALATVAGVMAFLVAWGTLSRSSKSTTVIAGQIERTPLAHGYDVVTVILADFRGFDTIGEVTVVAIAFLGIISLIRRDV
jgi:multicomponent Na+:H+ antiporter subunit A